MNRFKKYLAALPAALAISPAFAAGVDVTTVTTAIGDQATSIAAIGAAVLTLLVGVKAYKWVRRAL